MDEQLENRVRILENRINFLEKHIDNLEKQIGTTRDAIDESLKAYASFAEVTSNSIAALRMAVDTTSEKVNTMHKILTGY